MCTWIKAGTRAINETSRQNAPRCFWSSREFISPTVTLSIFIPLFFLFFLLLFFHFLWLIGCKSSFPSLTHHPPPLCSHPFCNSILFSPLCYQWIESGISSSLPSLCSSESGTEIDGPIRALRGCSTSRCCPMKCLHGGLTFALCTFFWHRGMGSPPSSISDRSVTVTPSPSSHPSVCLTVHLLL